MCNIISVRIGNKKVKVADIKKDYIMNIAEKAKACESIDRIMLFGSALNEQCTQKSDIDIAVFGKVPEGRMLKSKDFKQFVGDVFRYDYNQNYDILYFDSNRLRNLSILNDINKGELLYEKA